ncbi:acetylhydrolase [Nitzschia inconspicua]|uniref:Acetylhydrolase n=1 Tax=Nitzschia inconspicua TaxID=303405 RepID=A0A9K3PSX5_9STRA|nr:acetylhydrolase [Nitzschia inconspicua]
MLTFLIRKLLLTFGYPRLESSHNLVGPYRHVGALQVRIPDSTACQIFYPSQSNNKSNKKNRPVPYFRPEAVQGLVDYLRFGGGLLEFLSERSHPCCWNVDPYPLPDQKFPLVLFSHGLAGTYEMYTELCRHIASLGYCVVALEHQDGSAAYAHDGKKVIPYKRPNDEPYSRQKVLTLRTPMLQQRVEELENVIRYFEQESTGLNNNNNNDNNSMHLLKKVIQATDTQDLHLVGHSFGGATQMLATQQWTSKSSKKKSMPQPKSLLVMDSWAFALTEDVVQQGLSKNDKTKIKILSIISEDWEQNNVERLEVAEFLKSSEANTNNHILSMVAPNAVHQSFSDSEAWFPSFVARQARNRGKGEDRHVTIRATVQEWGRMNNKLNAPTECEKQKRRSQKSPSLRPWIVTCLMLISIFCVKIYPAMSFQSTYFDTRRSRLGVQMYPPTLSSLYASKKTEDTSAAPPTSVQFSASFNDSLVSSDNPLDQLLALLSSDIVSIVLGSVGLLAVVINRLALLDASTATADALTSETRADLLAVFACGSVLLNGVTKLDVTTALAESVVLDGTTLSESEFLTERQDEEATKSLSWALNSLLTATPAKTATIMTRNSNGEWKVYGRAGVVPVSPNAMTVSERTPILDRVGSPNNIKETYLPTLQALPGRVEFTYLPSNTQLALLIPISSGMVLVLGSNAAKSFSPRDIAWSRVVAERIGEYL